jgi:DNA-binding NarL/FixJ family response regulator
MTNPLIQIDDEVREMTAEEVSELNQMQAEAKGQLDAEAARLAARQSALAKLKALGLTEAEIAAL